MAIYELTTAVMWLNDRELAIRCVRVKPYRDGNRIFLDVQQIIPLPEAEDYRVQIKEKQRQERNRTLQAIDVLSQAFPDTEISYVKSS